MATGTGPSGRRAWPYGGAAASPPAITAIPDGTTRSDRATAGPLRLGTAPAIGPRGAAGTGASDFGMDRGTPRGFDVIGTGLDRYGQQASSPLIAGNRRR